MKKKTLSFLTVICTLVIFTRMDAAAQTDDGGEFDIPSQAQLNELLAGSSDTEAAGQLAQLITGIENSGHTETGKQELLAQLTQRAVQSLGDRAPKVMAALAGDLSESSLPTVAAAAVVSSGTQSPKIVSQMTGAFPEDSPSIAVINQAASEPGQILGARLMGRIAAASADAPPSSRPGRTRPGGVDVLSINASSIVPIGTKYAGQ